MKIIPAETMAQMQALIESGHGIRATARLVGLDRKTVAKYYPREGQRLCACGKPALHKGWCSVRVARSQNRQKHLARLTRLRPETVGKWSQLAQWDAQRTAYIDLRNRLDAAWFKQAVIRENEALGTDRLIAIAEGLAERKVRHPLIAEDVVQDFLVMMLDGTVEASKLAKSPLVAQTINRECFIIGWTRRHVSIETGGHESESIKNLQDGSMTKDEFMAVAWRDFILWAHEQPEMRAAFTKATGVAFIAPAANALEAAIDEAAGVHSQTAAAFVRWVTENHWCMDEAPDDYKRAVGYEPS